MRRGSAALGAAALVTLAACGASVPEVDRTPATTRERARATAPEAPAAPAPSGGDSTGAPPATEAAAPDAPTLSPATDASADDFGLRGSLATCATDPLPAATPIRRKGAKGVALTARAASAPAAPTPDPVASLVAYAYKRRGTTEWSKPVFVRPRSRFAHAAATLGGEGALHLVVALGSLTGHGLTLDLARDDSGTPSAVLVQAAEFTDSGPPFEFPWRDVRGDVAVEGTEWGVGATVRLRVRVRGHVRGESGHDKDVAICAVLTLPIAAPAPKPPGP